MRKRKVMQLGRMIVDQEPITWFIWSWPIKTGKNRTRHFWRGKRIFIFEGKTLSISQNPTVVSLADRKMALNSILRRASSSVLPLALRSAATPRTFHHAISAAITVGKHNFTQDLNPSFFLPFLRSYSAAPAKNKADTSLIRVLESEIKCAEEDDQNGVDEVPEEFPFEIQDNPGERTISLTRKYEDETIKVEVDIPNVGAEDEEEDKDEAGENDEQTREESSIPLVVSISKDNGECLEFGVTAFPDEISIDHLSIKKPDGSEEQLAYEGPEFHDLDENLQKAFHKYLEIRGIKPSATNFLHEYMINKDSREYSMWLKNLKNFVEK